MAKIWATLFASAGDKEVIPVPPEADGSVSVTQGWTPDYELPNTDPSYKPVGREEMNGAFNAVTESIQQLQLQGAAEWSASLGAYPKGAEVIHSGERWYNTTAGNTTTPGVGANWINVRVLASETLPGIVEKATAAEAQAFTADKYIDAARLASAFQGANQSLGTSGYQKLPGGFIIQAAQANIASGTSLVIVFPVAFTTACMAFVAMDFGGQVSLGTVSTPTTTGVTLTSSTPAPGACSWIAIGY